VKTLTLEGLLEFDERDKTYSPGLGLTLLSAKTSIDQQRFQRIEPEIANLAKRFSCTASFWRLARDRLVLINSVRGATALNVHLETGLRLPALLGAMGRCVAGDLTWDRSQIESAFRELNWQNPPSFRTYLREAAAARDRGWAFDIDNYMRGLTIVAAPLRDGHAKIRYCIANIVLSGSRARTELEELGAATSTVAEALGKTLFATDGRYA
jgi:DNA-binding IclR family transcriptional regulator